MKQQVARFSPHQNGKVFGVLMALGALVVVVPFFAAISAMAPLGAANAFPGIMILIMPVMYLVFGYLSIAAGCLMYNLMFMASRPALASVAPRSHRTLESVDRTPFDTSKSPSH